MFASYKADAHALSKCILVEALNPSNIDNCLYSCGAVCIVLRPIGVVLDDLSINFLPIASDVLIDWELTVLNISSSCESCLLGGTEGISSRYEGIILPLFAANSCLIYRGIQTQ
jgi:hypothetical protein